MKKQGGRGLALLGVVVLIAMTGTQLVQGEPVDWWVYGGLAAVLLVIAAVAGPKPAT